jgi:hypothetical protein
MEPFLLSAWVPPQVSLESEMLTTIAATLKSLAFQMQLPLLVE